MLASSSCVIEKNNAAAVASLKQFEAMAAEMTTDYKLMHQLDACKDCMHMFGIYRP